jgi:hypothetical protein
MPRILRSPQTKLSEIGNVSVPDADGEMRAAGIGRLTGCALCRRLWFRQNRPGHYWPLGVRRSIADFAIEGLTKLHAHDLEACCNSFDAIIIGTLFRP